MVAHVKHSGIIGQKWGIRRWQYSDGSLTPEGRIHYGVGAPKKEAKGYTRALNKLERKRINALSDKESYKKYAYSYKNAKLAKMLKLKRWDNLSKKYEEKAKAAQSTEREMEKQRDRIKKKLKKQGYVLDEKAVSMISDKDLAKAVAVGMLLSSAGGMWMAGTSHRKGTKYKVKPRKRGGN